MQNIDIFPWNEHFNTGIKIVDEQHRNLVDIINRLAKHVALGTESVELNTIFDELIEYTVYHFQTEEEIWHKYLPNDTLDLDHKAIHQQFVTKVLEFKAEQESNKLTKDVLLYLAKWLASHILESDRYLAYVVLAVEDGLELHQAKAMADERMKELTQVLTEVILSIYSSLSSNTMDLIREMKAHDSAALALKKKKEELETIFNTSKDGIAILDLNANFLDANRAYLEMTGYDLEELLTKSYYELSLPEDRNRALETIKSVIENGSITNFEKKCVVNNGKNIIINMSFAMMPDKKRIIISTKDVSEYKEQERKLQYVVHYDIVTGLPNRVLLSDRLQQVMSHAKRNHSELAVVYLDLDGFKTINDLYGHAVGDILLSTLATKMKKTLREGDTIARIGGDEFVIVLLDIIHHEDCIPMLIRLLSITSESVVINGISMNVSASIGVCFYKSGDNLDADQLIRQADQAMYQAKLLGKNRYHIFDAVQDHSVRIHHEGLEEIEKAFINEEFILYYQPKVNMRTGKVIGAEALIRWNHPQKGIVSPGLFLPVIEGHSLSVRIGEWVIKRAIEQIVEFKRDGMHIPISVNVDALQLQQDNFVKQLQSLLLQHPEVKQGDLELEILETSALEDIDRISSVMKECQQIGIHFSLDDFGTGYSSLTYLKRLPAKLLKIDQSFVRGMLSDPDDLAILDGVIGLSVAFQRDIIAEGVETIEHGEMLLRLGCEKAQGYVIAKPMPPENFSSWMKEWKPSPTWHETDRIKRDNIQLLFSEVEHKNWVNKIVSYLKDVTAGLPVLDSHTCAFGKWLNENTEKQYTVNPYFVHLKQTHEELHHIADLMLKKKDIDEIVLQEGIDKLLRKSNLLIDLLKKLQTF